MALSRFQKEQLLKSAGFSVAPHPVAEELVDDWAAQRAADNRFLAACEVWDGEIDRMYEELFGRSQRLAA